MGSCCSKDHPDYDPEYTEIISDEFQDPYNILGKNISDDPEIVRVHGPPRLMPITYIPRDIVKLENVINQRCPEPRLSLYRDAFVLRPYEIFKGCYYFGQWRDGRKHGAGKLYFPDHSAYSG